MDIESAHKRAPIEIWDTILNLAIISPLIPHSDDDVVDLYQLFVSGRDSMRIHRRVEGIRAGLRLVCRGWNSVLKDKGVKLGVDEVKDDGVHRWEAYTAFSSFAWRPSIAPVTPAFHNTENQAQEYPNLTIFMALDVQKHPIAAVETMGPQLRALQYPCVPVFKRVHASPQSSWIQSLTHLELTDITQAATTLGGEQVTLPRLRVLSLKFVNSVRVPTITGERLWLTWWLLPSLQTLKISGIIAAELADDMYQFLSRAWPNMTSLFLAPTRLLMLELRPFTIQPILWVSFPNLQIFGTNFGVGASSVPPPPLSYRRICLALDSVWDTLQTSGIPSLGAALQTLDEWKIDTIIFHFTWEEITSSVRDVYKRRRDPLSSMRDFVWPSWFILAGLNANTQLIDADRVLLSQEHRVELQELLRNWYQAVPSI